MTSNAVATRDPGQEIIRQYQADFALVLPSHARPDSFVRLSQGLLRRNDALARAARKNPGSLLSALLDCARLGLEPGDTYHLVPFGTEIVGIPDYTGEIELIYRAGVVSSIKAEIVYEQDEFEFTPDMDRPKHKPDWFGDRGAMKGAYAYAIMKDGSTSRVVVMNKADIEKVKKVSKTATRSDSPWQQWPDRMWLKTVVKQLSKWVPSSAEYAREAARASAEADAIRAKAQLPAQAPVDYIDGQVVDTETGEIHDIEVVDDGQPDEAEQQAILAAEKAEAGS
jgi:recombination protein RecT